MKKNKMMRIASVLLVAVLLSTCAISGTFAKYITEVSSSDYARVAKWGFDTASISIADLFKESYTNVATATDNYTIIAPGTSGFTTFKFEAEGEPEVDYTFSVVATEECSDLIKKSNIKWALVTGTQAPAADSGEWGTWDAMIAEINALSGTGSYTAGNLPDMVNKDYAICWMWAFTSSNDGKNAGAETTVDNEGETTIVSVNDTYLGNAAVSEDLKVELTITITAEQTQPVNQGDANNEENPEVEQG
jgi:hypothetical protein